jgi:hypothetical protein
VIPPTLGLPENIKLSWVTAEIASQMTPHLRRLNQELGRSHSSERFHAVAMQDADPRNDYICNNISYTLAAALQTPTLPLAGQRLRLESNLNQKTTGVGFVHYPKNANPNDNHEVWLWAHVALSLAKTATE